MARRSSSSVRPCSATWCELVAADLEHLGHPARLAAGVDAEHAAVGVGGGVGVHRVGQAALLADLLEQPGAHAAAEGGVEHAERPAALVGAGQAGHAEHDVGLLGARGRGSRRGPRCGWCGRRSRGAAGTASASRSAPARSKARADLAYDRGVVDVAGRGDDQVGRVVVLAVEAGDLVAGQRVDGLDGAEDRAAERGVAEQRGGEQVVHLVAGVVLGHGDLFEDDAALGVDVLLADQRAGEHVADHVDGQRQVGVEHPRVVAGVLLGGERVHLAADRVDRGGDVERAAPLGALEQQVFQVVGGAVERPGSRRGSRRRPRCRRSPSGRSAGSR